MKNGETGCVWRIIDAGLPKIVHKLSDDLRLRHQPSADGTKSVNARRKRLQSCYQLTAVKLRAQKRSAEIVSAPAAHRAQLLSRRDQHHRVSLCVRRRATRGRVGRLCRGARRLSPPPFPTWEGSGRDERVDRSEGGVRLCLSPAKSAT